MSRDSLSTWNIRVVIDPHMEFKGMPPMTSLCSDSTQAEFIISMQNLLCHFAGQAWAQYHFAGQAWAKYDR